MGLQGDLCLCTTRPAVYRKSVQNERIFSMIKQKRKVHTVVDNLFSKRAIRGICERDIGSERRLKDTSRQITLEMKHTTEDFNQENDRLRRRSSELKGLQGKRKTASMKSSHLDDLLRMTDGDIKGFKNEKNGQDSTDHHRKTPHILVSDNSVRDDFIDLAGARFLRCQSVPNTKRRFTDPKSDEIKLRSSDDSSVPPQRLQNRKHVYRQHSYAVKNGGLKNSIDHNGPIEENVHPTRVRSLSLNSTNEDRAVTRARTLSNSSDTSVSSRVSQLHDKKHTDNINKLQSVSISTSETDLSMLNEDERKIHEFLQKNTRADIKRWDKRRVNRIYREVVMQTPIIQSKQTTFVKSKKPLRLPPMILPPIYAVPPLPLVPGDFESETNPSPMELALQDITDEEWEDLEECRYLRPRPKKIPG